MGNSLEVGDRRLSHQTTHTLLPTLSDRVAQATHTLLAPAPQLDKNVFTEFHKSQARMPTCGPSHHNPACPDPIKLKAVGGTQLLALPTESGGNKTFYVVHIRLHYPQNMEGKKPFTEPHQRACRCCPGNISSLQGYLAHKKTPSP